jgi:serine/threonine protein kinase
LTDLGLAREVSEDEYRVTRMGTTIGTVDYMAPEQARDSSAADARSDIYSLGCTFFHMLSGVAPFPQGSLPERIMHHLETPPPDIRKLNPAVSRRLAAILEKMLAKKPGDRYQTPDELLADLEGKGPIPSTSADQDSLQALRELAAEDRRRTAEPTRVLNATMATHAEVPRSASAGRRVAAASASSRKLTRRDDEEETPPQSGFLPSWWPLVVAFIGILVASIIIINQLRFIEEEPLPKSPQNPTGIKK